MTTSSKSRQTFGHIFPEAGAHAYKKDLKNIDLFIDALLRIVTVLPTGYPELAWSPIWPLAPQ